MNEPVREPTTKTSRIATVSLVALACVSFGLGTCITLSHTYLSLIGVFGKNLTVYSVLFIDLVMKLSSVIHTGCSNKIQNVLVVQMMKFVTE